MNKSKIGILAGMGPRSTAPFLEKVIDECQRQYGATYDMDFPEIHIISLPTPFYPGSAIDSAKMIEALQRGITDLVKSNVSLLSIPCNLAHCYFDEISEVSQGTPLLHIADALYSFLPPRHQLSVYLPPSPPWNPVFINRGWLPRGSLLSIPRC